MFAKFLMTLGVLIAVDSQSLEATPPDHDAAAPERNSEFLRIPLRTSSEPRSASRVARIDASLRAAGKYLLAQQDQDGAWYSDTYGAFRAGPTLTPYVMSCLLFLPQAGPQAPAAYQRGVAYLADFVGRDGQLAVHDRELMFPVYTAGMASRVVVYPGRTAEQLRAQQAWLEYLRGRQLDETLGWQPSDPEYGGWGFSIAPPRKAPPGEFTEPFFESNLAATIFGLAALKSARVPRQDPAYSRALALVKRCQNFADTAERGDPAFDDGGFFFIPGDAVQNKAGVAGTDRHGRTRFRSYGTMTADGLRALLSCGLPANHPRVAAARAWLESSFSTTCNPGQFEGDREVLQNATYYYWVWACAHAFQAVRQRHFDTDQGRLDWAEALSDELLRRQQADGAWRNRFTDAKEDDPLVATSWAASALAICRAVITGRRETLFGSH